MSSNRVIFTQNERTYEYDATKSELNRQKHGLEFRAAAKIWSDTNLLEIPARVSEETRSLLIGKIGILYWTAVITMRGPNIRIISVRRSRKREILLYESQRL
jgi:uncharacterized DUF497 family protein